MHTPTVDPVSQYLKEVGACPLLKWQEEQALGLIIEKGRVLTSLSKEENSTYQLLHNILKEEPLLTYYASLIEKPFSMLEYANPKFIELHGIFNKEKIDSLASQLTTSSDNIENSITSISGSLLSLPPIITATLEGFSLPELKKIIEHYNLYATIKSCQNSIDAHYNEITKEGDQARERFFISNLRLTISIAKKIGSSENSMTLLDKIQEGNIGLLKAINKYSFRKGLKFSTYGTWWIRQAITRGIADQSRLIRLPVHMHESMRKTLSGMRELEAVSGEEPTTESIAAKINLLPSQVEEILSHQYNTMSLDEPLTNSSILDDRNVRNDFLASTDTSPDEEAIKNLLQQNVREILENSLQERELIIIKLRFGIGYDRTHTLEEVGTVIGVTRERIRQIEAQIIRKLRKIMTSKHLDTFLHERENYIDSRF